MSRLSRLPILIVAWAIAMTSSAAELQGQQWTPPRPTNLKVLPENTDPKALVMTMRSFALGLGVRCQHCHVYKGDDPNDLNTFDFASDDKAPKQTARTMLKMVQAINHDHLKDVGEARPAGELKVTCYTCHRGDKKPLTRPPDR